MRIRTLILTLCLALTGAVSNYAQAQQSGIVSLPPALRAAVMSGNAQAVSQAINTLSGGNPQRAADLANLVVTAAEQMLSVNPQAAMAAAGAAVETVRNTTVQTSGPTQTQSVLTTAARVPLMSFT